MTARLSRFGKRSTADEVLSELDLSGRTILVTGCGSGIGFETMRSLAAHGAHVIGTARSQHRAAEACALVGGHTTPIACDQDDFASVLQGVEAVRALGLPLDAIIANAGIMAPRRADVRYGTESQFRVNHLSHMLLVTRLADSLRDGSGRLVMVSSSAAQSLAPKGGIAFDNLDAHKGYRRLAFYGQSKLANLAFAKTMAKRLAERRITSNALHPGIIASTDLPRALPSVLRLLMPFASALGKSIAQGAATQCYLAAHADVADVTAGFFADCQPAEPNPLANDPLFQERLWHASEQILRENTVDLAPARS